jgi:hypothetical protein
MNRKLVEIGDRVVCVEGNAVKQFDAPPLIGDVIETQLPSRSAINTYRTDTLQDFHIVTREGDFTPAG